MLDYASVDIETTGLKRRHQVLEIGVVIDGPSWSHMPVFDLPSLRITVNNGDLHGDPFALAMNAKLIERIAKGTAENLTVPTQVFEKVQYFVTKHLTPQKGKVTAAGKNFASFDRQFLRLLDGRFDELFHHRSIDAGNQFIDWTNDAVIPDTAACIKRAGLGDESQHDAVEDARLVCAMLRAKRRQDEDADRAMDAVRHADPRDFYAYRG